LIYYIHMVPGIDYTGVSIAFYCHDGSKNFLFRKRCKNCRDQQGRWDCGGGKLEFGESIEDGVKREIKEEYGCDCEIEAALAPISFFEDTYRGSKHWIVLPHIVRVNRVDVITGDPDSIDELTWVTLDNLPSPLHTNIGKELEIYKKEFEAYR